MILSGSGPAEPANASNANAVSRSPNTSSCPPSRRERSPVMSVFSGAEIAYLQSKSMGRLATIGADGRPHLLPLTYHFNADEDTIDIGGIDFGNTKKWRDMLDNPHVAFLVDDASPDGARAIEIRGDAEPHLTGGELINPRFPNFKPQFVRVRAHRVVSWGIDSEGFQPHARNVS
jgi:pyridoxamine 5'-phosphate oxidase family protein